jgi:hypothetical protein
VKRNLNQELLVRRVQEEIELFAASIKFILQSFQSYQEIHVKRDANLVAH